MHMPAADGSVHTLEAIAATLADALQQSNTRIVFAESCTAGLCSATLGSVPGISEHLCGSAVTYRNDTKMQWLGVSRNALSHAGPVSQIVAQQMASGALERTPEADLAVSITGHLGPDAPEDIDGVVFIGVADRGGEPSAIRHQLQDGDRRWRQRAAAILVLDTARHVLQ